VNSQRFGRKSRVRSVGRRVISLMTLLAFIVCLFPIAIPRFQSKSSHTPFPCQDCACGCQTPEQCWTHCCCFTPKQRAAWAKEKGITPPSYAILDEPSPKIATGPKVSKPCCTEKTSRCCEESTLTACCESKSTKSSTSHSCKLCESKEAKSKNPSPQEQVTESSSKPSRYVPIMTAFKCKGLTLSYALLPVFDFSLAAFFGMFPSFSDSILSVNFFELDAYHPVPIPPPKL
jgi:hypothetical protein